jgi:hypothetical protein
MTIQVELSPEIEAQLTSAARANGVPPEKYAGSLLQNALTSAIGSSGRLTVDELHTMLREIARGSESLPVLPASASSRESFYQDRL